MSLLNRFKGKKELEVTQKASVVEAPVEKKATSEKVIEKKTTKKKTRVVRTATTQIILEPLVTEKAARLGALNTYVFRVACGSTRVQILEAFTDLYGVRPRRVNVANHRAEPVRFGRKFGKQAAWKKALITLPKGKEIQIYEGV